MTMVLSGAAPQSQHPGPKLYAVRLCLKEQKEVRKCPGLYVKITKYAQFYVLMLNLIKLNSVLCKGAFNLV